MKTEFKIEIETEEMSNDLIPEDEGVTVKDCVSEVEDSIHRAIPRIITDERVIKLIYEIIDEGGWIEDVEDCEFLKDYCKKIPRELCLEIIKQWK